MQFKSLVSGFWWSVLGMWRYVLDLQRTGNLQLFDLCRWTIEASASRWQIRIVFHLRIALVFGYRRHWILRRMQLRLLHVLWNAVLKLPELQLNWIKKACSDGSFSLSARKRMLMHTLLHIRGRPRRWVKDYLQPVPLFMHEMLDFRDRECMHWMRRS